MISIYSTGKHWMELPDDGGAEAPAPYSIGNCFQLRGYLILIITFVSL